MVVDFLFIHSIWKKALKRFFGFSDLVFPLPTSQPLNSNKNFEITIFQNVQKTWNTFWMGFHTWNKDLNLLCKVCYTFSEGIPYLKINE